MSHAVKNACRATRMIDLQAHSTVSDGELEPADVVARGGRGGRHDDVAHRPRRDRGRPGGDRAARRGRESSACRRSRCPASTRTPTICTCSATGSTSTRSRPPAIAPSRSASTAREEIIERLNAHGVEVTLRGRRRRGRAPRTRSAVRTSPVPPAPARTWAPSSRSTWCPARRPSCRDAGRRAEQAVELIHDGRRRGRRRPSLLGRLGARARCATWSRASTRDVGLDGIETFYPPHTKAQTAHCLELCEELGLVPTGSSDFHGPTHKTFAALGRLRHLRPGRARGAASAP